MVKRLTKHGNSMALVIDRPILELLNIDSETPLEISTDGKQLIIAPANHRGAGRSSRPPSNRRTSDTARRSRGWRSESKHSVSRDTADLQDCATWLRLTRP